jgi:hypothetical protein
MAPHSHILHMGIPLKVTVKENTKVSGSVRHMNGPATTRTWQSQCSGLCAEADIQEMSMVKEDYLSLIWIKGQAKGHQPLNNITKKLGAFVCSSFESHA